MLAKIFFLLSCFSNSPQTTDLSKFRSIFETRRPLITGPGKLFYVCRVCTQDQGFISFKSNEIKLSVKERNWTGSGRVPKLHNIL